MVAVTGALATLLHERKEFPQELVVSVPVSARSTTTSGYLGNQVGVMPVRVPLEGSVEERLAAVSRITRARKMRTRGTSSALIGPLFRILAAVRLFRRFVDRQRLVNSFLTNLPGPAGQLVIAGAPITDITPITVTAGNVGVAFAALSYAGTLGSCGDRNTTDQRVLHMAKYSHRMVPEIFQTFWSGCGHLSRPQFGH